EKRLSLYSSKGNHTIAESAALIYTGVLFPEMHGANRWREKGLSILMSEAQYQILPDGGGVEQSFNYLAFISDLLGLVIKLLEHYQLAVPQEIKTGFIRGGCFLNRMSDNSKSLPSVGDSDNGFALSKYLNFKNDEGRKNPGIETFSESGYTLFRNQDNPPATLIFDHGPLGMPPSYGHGHADALSIILRLGDLEILTDPGTYTYNGDPSWRSYFKSTCAHNTVTVDETDQAIQKASFIWSEPFQSRVISSEITPKGVFRILARHNGYSRLKEGVEHFRGISYVPSGYWLIWDYITGKGVHTLDLNWHLACDFVQEGGKYRILNPIHPVSLSIQGGETSVYSGSTHPILGWNSPMYGVKEPITTLQTRYCGTLPHEFITRIKIDEVPQLSFFESTERFILKGWTI
ncbi:MAG: alginate lyase family protein, partial [Nitrospiria bacterium]